MTEASIRALEHLRDFSTLKWYVIPLLAIVLYIYAIEMRKARAGRNWDAVFAGLTLFGMDFFNETWNGWVLAVSGRSALWTTPGDTALRTLVGWNIEIMFMFAIAGIVFYYMCPENRIERILGLPARWFWAVFLHGVLRARGMRAQRRRSPGLGVPFLEPHVRRASGSSSSSAISSSSRPSTSCLP